MVFGIDFAPASEQDARELAANMRETDAHDAAMLHGWTPEEAAVESVRCSDVCWSARHRGKLCCLFGGSLATIVDNLGVIWELGTPYAECAGTKFLRGSRIGLELVSSALPAVETFTNLVASNNHQSLRWLEWLGAWFSVDPQARGVLGGRFKRFCIRSVLWERREKECA